MPDFSQKPTGEDIDWVFGHLSEVWADTHARFRKVDEFYNQTFRVWPAPLDATRRSYRPGTAAAKIDNAAATQLAFEPSVHRQPVGDAKGAQETSDRVEVGAGNVLNDASMRETSIPAYMTGRYLASLGYSVLEGPVLAPFKEWPEPAEEMDSDVGRDFQDREEIFKAEMRNWNPFRFRAPHPSTVLMDHMTKHPEVAIKLEKRFRGDLRDLTIRKKKIRRLATVDIFDDKGKSPYERMDVLQFWSRKWHAVRVRNGPVLYIEPNTWGIVPFRHAFSGLGQPRTSGQINDGENKLQGSDPRHLAVGIIEHIFDSLVVQAQSMSAKHQVLNRVAYGPLLVGDEDSSEVREAFARDGIANVDPTQIGYVDPPRVGAWLNALDENVDMDIDETTFIRALAGVRQEGVTTVGQQAMLSKAAQRKFANMAAQQEDMWTGAVADMLRMMDRLPELENGVLGLHKRDIAHDYNIRITFENIDPVLHLQERQTGLTEVGAGVKSAQTYRERDLRVPNETEEQDRLAQERLENMPELQTVLDREMAERMGLADQFDQAIELRSQAMQGGPNGSGQQI